MQERYTAPEGVATQKTKIVEILFQTRRAVASPKTIGQVWMKKRRVRPEGVVTYIEREQSAVIRKKPKSWKFCFRQGVRWRRLKQLAKFG